MKEKNAVFSLDTVVVSVELHQQAFLMQEMAESICTHPVPRYQAPTLVCICCSPIKLAFLRWVAVSVYLSSNKHLVFIFCLWKNVHESTHSTSEFIRSFGNSKKNRNAHFLDYIECKRLKINGKEMDQVKLVSSWIPFHSCVFWNWVQFLSSDIIWNANNKVI